MNKDDLIRRLKNGELIDDGEELSVYPIPDGKFAVDYIVCEGSCSQYEDDDGASEIFDTAEEAVDFYLEKKSDGY